MSEPVTLKTFYEIWQILCRDNIQGEDVTIRISKREIDNLRLKLNLPKVLENWDHGTLFGINWTIK